MCCSRSAQRAADTAGPTLRKPQDIRRGTSSTSLLTARCAESRSYGALRQPNLYLLNQLGAAQKPPGPVDYRSISRYPQVEVYAFEFRLIVKDLHAIGAIKLQEARVLRKRRLRILYLAIGLWSRMPAGSFSSGESCDCRTARHSFRHRLRAAVVINVEHFIPGFVRGGSSLPPLLTSAKAAVSLAPRSMVCFSKAISRGRERAKASRNADKEGWQDPAHESHVQ